MSLENENIEALLRALGSDDATVRADAARALGTCGEHAVAAPALLSMLSDVDDLVRAEAVDALGILAHKEAVTAVRGRLREDLSPLVRAAAAETLGDLGEPAAIPELIGALDDDDDAVRGYAANALGLLAGVEILPLLELRLGAERSATVRIELQGALARLGAPGAFAALLSSLDDMDEDLGINMLNLWDDLVSRRPPPDLSIDTEAVVRALSSVADRFPILRQQAQALTEHVLSYGRGADLR